MTARLRLALAVTVGGAVALLMPSVLATTVDAPAAVVLTALAVAVAAVVALSSHCATSVPRVLALQGGPVYEVPSVLAGRVTDPLHHPLRPRAPGLGSTFATSGEPHPTPAPKHPGEPHVSSSTPCRMHSLPSSPLPTAGLTSLGADPGAGTTWLLCIAAVVVTVRVALLPLVAHGVRLPTPRPGPGRSCRTSPSGTATAGTPRACAALLAASGAGSPRSTECHDSAAFRS